MQKLRSFHLLTLPLLLIFSLFITSCGGNSDPKSDDIDNTIVKINYDTESKSWWLHFNSDEPVLCAVNLGEANSDAEIFTQLQSMDMSSPVKEHSLELTLTADMRYSAMLTTFDTANNVQRSQTFHFTATRNPDGDINLIEKTVTQLMDVDNLSNASEIWQVAPSSSEVTSNSATIQFETDKATLASTAYGKSANFGLSTRMAGGMATTEHSFQLLALSAETTYHYNTIVVDPSGKLYQSTNFTFMTEQDTQPKISLGSNVALSSLGASIASVSSNWNNGSNSSNFGANNAIDDDPDTEWSSNGDGNNASIEITLDKPYTITGIGFWTRTMESSAQIARFEVLTTDGTSLGIFDLRNANQLYQFDIPDTQQQTLKFQVISSNGGNTGARSIEVYGSL